VDIFISWITVLFKNADLKDLFAIAVLVSCEVRAWVRRK